MVMRIKRKERFKAMFLAWRDRRLRTSVVEDHRVLAAVECYRKGDVSTGAAAELAGIPKTLLLMKLGDYGIDTFDMSEEEFQRDLDDARRLLQHRCRGDAHAK